MTATLLSIPDGTLVGITGASGMIGRHLQAYLERTFPNIRLRCLVRDIPSHLPSSRVEWMPGDLFSEVDCREFVKGLRIVIHLAQANNPASSDRDWPGDHAANGQLTLNLLQALRDRGGSPAHFVYASSGGAIYGPWRGRPFREEDECLPLSPYGIQKLAAEHYLRLAVQQGWLTASILRIANAYGAPLHPERRQGLIGVAIGRAAAGLPLRLFGSPDTIRDYVHLDDLVRAFAAAAFPREGFGVWNIGGGKGYSTAEIFALIERVAGRSLVVEQFDYGKNVFDLVPHVVLNIEKANFELGWTPQISLPDGINRLWRESFP